MSEFTSATGRAVSARSGQWRESGGRQHARKTGRCSKINFRRNEVISRDSVSGMFGQLALSRHPVAHLVHRFTAAARWRAHRPACTRIRRTETVATGGRRSTSPDAKTFTGLRLPPSGVSHRGGTRSSSMGRERGQSFRPSRAATRLQADSDLDEATGRPRICRRCLAAPGTTIDTAARWSSSDSGRTYTVTLRPGVTSPTRRAPGQARPGLPTRSNWVPSPATPMPSPNLRIVRCGRIPVGRHERLKGWEHYDSRGVVTTDEGAGRLSSTCAGRQHSSATSCRR